MHRKATVEPVPQWAAVMYLPVFEMSFRFASGPVRPDWAAAFRTAHFVFPPV
jgi:hypothetical protein